MGVFCSPHMWSVPWAWCGARLGLFRGSVSKKARFQKNDRFWSVNRARKINRRGPFECGPTPHTHGPLIQSKPHVKRRAGWLTALKSLNPALAWPALLARAGPPNAGATPPVPKKVARAPWSSPGRNAAPGEAVVRGGGARLQRPRGTPYRGLQRHGPGSASSQNPKARGVPYPLEHPKYRGNVGFGFWGVGRGSTQNILSPGGLCTWHASST